jgi:ParB-like chromosome segregation protein Spo0J
MKVHLVPLTTIKEMPGNPRKITNEELKALMRSLRKFGMPQQAIVFKPRDPSDAEHENEVIGGHQRIKAAKALSQRPPSQWGKMRKYLERGVVPVSYWTGSYREARALNVALNKIGGDFDVDKLGEFLSDLANDQLIRATGFTDEELAALTEQLGQYTPKLAPGEVKDMEIAVEAQPIRPREPKKIRCPKCAHRFSLS